MTRIGLNCRFKMAVFTKAMASPEEKAYEIMRELDVDYVLVIFGGMVGYSSDGKFSKHFALESTGRELTRCLECQRYQQVHVDGPHRWLDRARHSHQRLGLLHPTR